MVVIPIGLLWPISELSYPVTAMSSGTMTHGLRARSVVVADGGIDADFLLSLGGDVAFIFEKKPDDVSDIQVWQRLGVFRWAPWLSSALKMPMIFEEGL